MVKKIKEYIDYLIGLDSIPVPNEIVTKSTSLDIHNSIIIADIILWNKGIMTREHVFISFKDFKKWLKR